MDERAWKEADFFPVIARFIRDEYARRQRFISAHEIANQLTRDPATRRAIEAGRRSLGNEQTVEWWAPCIAAWFGQCITLKRSDYCQQFACRKENGEWAYKPRDLVEHMAEGRVPAEKVLATGA